MSAHPSGNVLSGLLMLLARLGIAAVFIVHGAQKLMQGMPATIAGFTQMGIPYPQVAAWFAVSVEVVGGALLVLGLLTRVVGLLLAADMLGALALVHFPNGFFVTSGGYEFVLALAAASLAFAGAGAGRLSIDAIFRRRRNEKRAAKAGVGATSPSTATSSANSTSATRTDDSAWASDRSGS